VFIFIWECTRLPNEIYSVSVIYIFDYKVKFLRYTRTYSLNGCGRQWKIFFFYNLLNDFVSFRFSVYIFCFVSFLSLQILFRFVVFRFISFCFVSFRFTVFRFYFVSHFTGTQTKGSKQDSQNSLRSPMPERGVPYFFFIIIP
jgi:hypothetical protein